MEYSLTNEQRELIVCLMEECSEVIKACSKTLRHGPNSFNPYIKHGPTNLQKLQEELSDIYDVVDRLVVKGLLNPVGPLAVNDRDLWLHGELLG